jgi:hypothetical protein
VQRKWDCRFYNKCLSKAARENLDDTPCKRCQSYEPIDDRDPGEGEVDGMIRLWKAVFDEDR